ncbi:SLC13 family permease [Bacillus haimaensis]|uniref:SLC13 family permease n=1 Tax=Bacillus haimaensis TaxID=3160967 RepID=UPI003AA8F750
MDETLPFKVEDYTTFYEVCISRNSTLLNKKIKESNFRSKYNAAIISVKRKEQQITSGIGNIILKPGDTLLLVAKRDFIKSWSDSDDFYFVSPVDQDKKQTPYIKKIVTILLFGIIISSAFQIIPIFNVVLIATAVIILTKILTVTEALKAINWNILILMGSAFGVGTAVESTGLAQILSSKIIDLQNSIGIVGILILFFVITMIMTEILNNLATAALMFPIGYSISIQLVLDPMMFAMITAIASNCSFLSPIGYQTNLLVYGPGGYRFKDYLKVGFPLSLLCMSVTILVAYFKWLY